MSKQNLFLQALADTTAKPASEYQSAIDAFLAKGGAIKKLAAGEKSNDIKYKDDPDDLSSVPLDMEPAPVSNSQEAEVAPEASEAVLGTLCQTPSLEASEDWSDKGDMTLPPGKKWIVPGAIYGSK